jgi:DNA polymerase V
VLALCDCNNFFVSCERLFRPDLVGKPVVVLSANDGCIIARSNEAKAMDIGMGVPYFKFEHYLRRKGVTVFSGNLHLYRQISKSVMAVLRRFTDAMEVYSIDEAFLNMDMRSVADPLVHAREMRAAVMRSIGIPISVGVAQTKTLAKLAGERAKKHETGVFHLTRESTGEELARTKTEDVWGIGWRNIRELRTWGIGTALDYARSDPLWIKKNFTVRGLVTQYELRGYPCIPIASEESPPKSIQVSHTFGEPLSLLEDLEKPVVEHAFKAGRMLRGHGLAARCVNVHLLEGFISREHRYVSRDAWLDRHASDDRELIAQALALLRQVFRHGSFYTKAGVTLSDLLEGGNLQLELFDHEAQERRRRLERLSAATDRINRHLGNTAIFPASLAVREGKQKWKCRSDLRSTGAPPVAWGEFTT